MKEEDGYMKRVREHSKLFKDEEPFCGRDLDCDPLCGASLESQIEGQRKDGRDVAGHDTALCGGGVGST